VKYSSRPEGNFALDTRRLRRTLRPARRECLEPQTKRPYPKIIRSFGRADETSRATLLALATKSKSKRACWRRWLAEEVHVPGTAGLKLGRFYLAMDRLEENEVDIQYAAFDRVAILVNVDADLVFFYDTSTVHWDIEDDDQERVWKRPPRDAFPFRLVATPRTSGQTALRSSSRWP